MTAKLMWIQCLSPLHAGVGQGVDVVDLAIARERATGIPYLPGSSIKGSLRDNGAKAWGRKDPMTIKVFGPETDNASEHAGSMAFGDAALVCLPVRSLRGTFAYVTSPYLMRRVLRDAKEAGLSSLPTAPVSLEVGSAHVPKNGNSMLIVDTKIYLEDLDFQSEDCGIAARFAEWLAAQLFDGEQEREMFKRRFVVVSDDVLSFFCTHATDVVTRVAIEHDTKTVKQGQLWTEENLPSESILVSLVGHIPVKAADLSADSAFNSLGKLLEGDVQFGGNATVGRGRCRVTLGGAA